MRQRKSTYRYLFSCFSLLFSLYPGKAQCPPNIGFESGTFLHWNCAVGEVDHNGKVNLFLNGIYPNRQVLTSASDPQSTDPYGYFPVICPSGGKYSVKLGNDLTGSQAEGMSYTFTIPASLNDYSFNYNYAVVFQDPGHLPFQQPRFTARVYDAATGQFIQCSSFDFVAAANLPGFLLSDVEVNGHKNVYYKSWSRASINLSGYAGKSIRIEFTTNDCTEGEHFGYAYVDVDDICGSIINGNISCTGQQSVLLTAPFGYMEYGWYDASLTTLLGTESSIRLSPLPNPGTVYGLIVKPYAGSGCTDTLFTTIGSVNAAFNFSVPDSAGICLPATANMKSSWITAGSSPGLSYSYYTDSLQQHYLMHPDSVKEAGLYYIKAVDANGCSDIRSVSITISNTPDFTASNPPLTYYPLKTDITSLSLITGNTSGISFSYWKDAAATTRLANPGLVDIAGTYFIRGTNSAGCSVMRPVTVVISIPPPPNAFTPNGDGVHDVWDIPGLQQYTESAVDVFNRWGQPVFHSKGMYTPWNGRIRGKLLPVGTYYYFISISKQLPLMTGYLSVIY